MSQDKFAALAGVSRDAQMNYENGSRRPDTSYLEKILEAGISLSSLFGKDDELLLTPDEMELIAGFRKLDVRAKVRLLGMLDGMTSLSNNSDDGKPSVVFHGSVGQQVVGDIRAPQTINVGRKKK